jgi:hypothetical protein
MARPELAPRPRGRVVTERISRFMAGGYTRSILNRWPPLKILPVEFVRRSRAFTRPGSVSTTLQEDVDRS